MYVREPKFCHPKIAFWHIDFRLIVKKQDPSPYLPKGIQVGKPA